MDCKIMGKLTYIKISNITKSFLVHTPDIIITDKNETPKLIIEQDGKIHDDDMQKLTEKIKQVMIIDKND